MVFLRIVIYQSSMARLVWNTSAMRYCRIRNSISCGVRQSGGQISLSDQVFLCDAFRCAEMKHVMDSAAPTIQPTGQADHMPR